MRIRLLFASLVLCAQSAAQSMTPRIYDVGSPVTTDIWVDPARGNDANSGATRAQALRTLNAAWGRIPQRAALTIGYRLMLAAGTYAHSDSPTYWEGRWGTYQYPVMLVAADGNGTAQLADMNVYDCRYLYLIGIQLTAGGGDVLHLEQCQWVLLRQVRLVGTGDITAYQAPDETLKANQCSHIFVEDSDISGAQANPIDFVAVQYGHIVGNRIHHGGDWCMYLKGGSAYFRIEANEIYDCGTGGFSAGQGSGLEYMVSPWLHYEAENMKFINNIVHDTEGAGFGVNGGYNILFAYNTLYRVGRRSHAIEIEFGSRGCDGNTAVCNAYIAQGAWGGIPAWDAQWIPSRDIFIYNNVLYNPSGDASAWSQFALPAPRTTQPGSNIPSPSTIDTNLQIRGNVIWNGPADLRLGNEDSTGACQSTNPSCNTAQLLRDNAINTLQPTLADPDHGNFAVRSGIILPASLAIPDFPGGDAAQPPSAPAGELSNAVTRDYSGSSRSASGPPGAIAGAGSRFIAVTPCRVADTRSGAVMAGNTSRSFAIPQSACNIPPGAQAYSLNVTVVPRSPLGYLSLWPTGQSRPLVSTLNSPSGKIVANAALVPAGANGSIDVYVTDTTDVVLDINGYFAAPDSIGALAFYPVTPCRISDTRNAAGTFGGPAIPAGGSRTIPIPSSTCGVPSTAQAYSLNATVVPKGSFGYLTLWPAGQAQPYVSTLNAPDGKVVANAAIVPAGNSGAISAYVTDSADLVLDINGYFAPAGNNGLSFYPAWPCRVVDTRNTAGMTAGSTRSFPVTGSGCGIPSTAQAFALNATVVPQASLGYLTLWPAGAAQPYVSTLNSPDGLILANATVVPAGTTGAVSAYVTGPTHLILDINGYFAP